MTNTGESFLINTKVFSTTDASAAAATATTTTTTTTTTTHTHTMHKI